MAGLAALIEGCLADIFDVISDSIFHVGVFRGFAVRYNFGLVSHSRRV